MPDLERLLERLLRHEVDFVVIGGYAAMAYGSTYVTFDVDVCTPLSGLNLQRIHAALADLHPCHRMTPQELPFVLPNDQESAFKNIYLKTDLGQIDCLGSLPEVGDYAFVRAHSVSMKLSFGEYRFLDCPTLVRAKEVVGRPKDLLVAAQLRALLDANSLPPQNP
jgi:hypothetical protein